MPRISQKDFSYDTELGRSFDATGIETAARSYRAGRAVVEFTVRMSCTTSTTNQKIYCRNNDNVLVEMMNLIYS
jgi:hypothetical protein